MRIALTGATGFIGSHYLKQALAEGHNVLAIRRSSSSKTRIHIGQEPKWLDRQLDKVSSDDLSGCQVLVHLATHTGNPPYDNLLNCIQWNVLAALKLFEQARLAGINHFIVAGSCFEYGHSANNFDEIPTDAPLIPTSSYAASKCLASIAFRQWAEEHELTLEIIRVFHVFGEGELETRFWPMLRQAALSGQDFFMTEGEQIRDFMNVSQVARLFLSRTITITQREGQRIYNMSSGNIMTIRGFAELWWKKWNAKGTLVFGGVPYRKNEIMRYTPGPDILNVDEFH